MRPRWILPTLALAAVLASFWFTERSGAPAAGSGARGGGGESVSADEPGATLERAADDLDSAEVPAGVERRATGAPGVQVRVLQRDTRAPLAGFYASMKSARDFLGEGTSDASGRVRFATPPPEGAMVAVEGPWGWFVQDASRRVEFREDGRYEALEFLAYSAGTARFRARLVDQLTHDPVPAYLVRLGTQDGRREDVVSDAEGVLESEAEYPEGDLGLFCHDAINPAIGANEKHPCSYQQIAFRIGSDGRALEQEIAIPVGPTYRLELEVPSDVPHNRWSADLRNGPYASINSLRAKETPVHWKDEPWVRFPPERVNDDRFESHLTLVVSSGDGAWRGAAEVRSSHGIYPERVKIPLVHCGRVFARVVEPGGEPIPAAQVALAPADGVDGTRLPQYQSSVANGLVEFELVAAGTYSISALSQQHERRSSSFVLEAGQRVDLELVLPRARLDGVIDGRLVVPAEFGIEQVRLSLLSLRPAGRSYLQTLSFERRGEERIASFRFDGLPAGDYQVWPSSAFDVDWSPHFAEVAAPAHEVEIRGRRNSVESSYGFEISDAVDGSHLMEFGLSRERDDGEAQNDELWSSLNFAPDAFTYYDSQPSPSERWAIYSPRHLPRTIAREDIVERDGMRIVRAALERGWSLEIRALGPGLTPLPGAKLFLDGAEAGESDASGRIHAVRERAPARIDVRYLDWSIESDGVYSLVSSLRTGAPSIRLLFSPR